MGELTAAFERHDLPQPAVDEVLKLLADEGVEVIETAPDEAEPRTPSRPAAAEAARRAATGDLVRIYLREIGRVPLLTAQDEVELAKAIEAGLFAEEKIHGDFAAATARSLGELSWSPPRDCGPSSASSRPTCGWSCRSPSATSGAAWCSWT